MSARNFNIELEEEDLKYMIQRTCIFWVDVPSARIAYDFDRVERCRNYVGEESVSRVCREGHESAVEFLAINLAIDGVGNRSLLRLTMLVSDCNEQMAKFR